MIREERTLVRPDPACQPTFAPNLTESPFSEHVTLNQLFERQVLLVPEHTALLGDADPFWGTDRLTYRRLNEASNQVACRLREHGIGPGHIVGILTERSFAMVVGIFGVMKAGGAYLPLSPDDPADRLAFVLKDAAASVLIVHEATAAKAPPGLISINLDDRTLYAASAQNLPPLATPSDLAYVIYTSGSTGRPKGVLIEHRAVVNRLEWMQRAYPIGENDVLLQKTAYTFDVSVWEMFWWSMQGAALSLLRPKAERVPLAIVEAIKRHRVSVMHFVPSMLAVFLEYLHGKPQRVGNSLASLRQVFTSGEALSGAHVKKFNDLIGGVIPARLTNLYGPTEATVDATYFDCPATGEPAIVPIGRPIQNMRAYVVDTGRVVGVGETGELCLAGVGLARGYLNRPDLTRERFVQDALVPGERVYRTGDLARWLPDGNLEYLGREDQQVKIRGLRIELGEIENAVRTFPGIADCVVVAKKYSDSIILLVAYVVAPEPLDREALKRHLRRGLPEYMVPNHFELLAAIPLTSSGKADRRSLPEPVFAAKAL
jgi:D-alanine--poly(phosphoribitol) ligase subunit 1